MSTGSCTEMRFVLDAHLQQPTARALVAYIADKAIVSGDMFNKSMVEGSGIQTFRQLTVFCCVQKSVVSHRQAGGVVGVNATLLTSMKLRLCTNFSRQDKCNTKRRTTSNNHQLPSTLTQDIPNIANATNFTALTLDAFYLSSCVEHS
jgi:hypothetical protein